VRAEHKQAAHALLHLVRRMLPSGPWLSIPLSHRGLRPHDERCMRSLLTGLGLLLLAACADDPAPGSVSTGGRDPNPEDAGLAGRDGGGRPSIRPDGGPILPPSDEALELPFGAAPLVYELSGEAGLGVLDLHLSVDTSGSIDREIDELQASLTDDILPALRDVVPELSVGVSRFEDFPLQPYGNPARTGQRADRPYELLTAITSDVRSIEAAVRKLDTPLGIGGDAPESGAEALFQVATGDGYEVAGDELIPPFDGDAEEGGGVLGGVGFRPGALHVVLHITDAPTHLPADYEEWFPGTRTLEEAGAALAGLEARVISIVSGACVDDGVPCNEGSVRRARDELEHLAFMTGAVTEAVDDECPHGIEGAPHPTHEDVCPLVFDVSDEGEGLAETFTEGVITLIEDIRFAKVTAIAADDPLGFVKRIEPVGGDDSPRAADLVPSGAPDGRPDTFVDVRGGAMLRFAITLRNDRLVPREQPQSFRVVLRVLGDDLIMAERTLRIVVPAGSLPTGPLFDDDAGW